MKNRFLVFLGILAGVAILTASASNLREFSLQQALNILAGNQRAPYTAFTSQQAANVLVNRQVAEQDSMIGTVVFVFDDNNKELWGTAADSLFVNPSPSQIKKTARAIMKENGIVGGLSAEPHNILYGDSSLILTKHDIDHLVQDYGFEVGMVGYNEPAGLYHGGTGLLAKGTYTKGMGLFEYDIRRGYEACRDSLGYTPRWISWSNSTAAAVLKKFAVRYVEFGFQPEQTATVASSEGRRPNRLIPTMKATYGAFGTGGAGTRAISAIPGLLPDRYEILQGMGEASDTAATYQTLRRAMQTRGMVVWVGHKPSLWENTLQGQNGFAAVCAYIKTMVDAGRLRVLVPSEACDLYFNAPISPACNYSTNNFQDYDADTHPDWWFSGRGNTAVAADTAKLLQKAGNVGHGGTLAMGLNWNGIASSATASRNWDGQTGDTAWETFNACLAVIAPGGGGWTVQFECWMICDTTVAGWNAGTAPQAGDSVGVLFGGPSEQENFTNSSTKLISWVKGYSGGGATPYTPAVSHPIYNNAGAPPFFKFTARNNMHRGANKEWMHVVASWDVPEFADYIFISIWKAGNVTGGTNPSPPNGIVISDYHVSFHRRFQMSNGASLTRF